MLVLSMLIMGGLEATHIIPTLMTSTTPSFLFQLKLNFSNEGIGRAIIATSSTIVSTEALRILGFRSRHVPPNDLS